jgi:hypothetical protein
MLWLGPLRLDVSAELTRAWIPAFAGMTLKARAAGMSGPSKNCQFATKNNLAWRGVAS